MNIGIIGSGGREHALCFKLRQSKIVDKIYCIPGNAGTNLIAENIDIKINDFEKIKKFSIKKKIELLVVGPEKPLVDGISDCLSLKDKACSRPPLPIIPMFIYILYILIMKNKLAKLKYLPNNFQIIENGDYVICAISGKKIPLEKLNYWNVELQEPYYSYFEAAIKKEEENK